MVAARSILLAVAGFVSLAQASPLTPSEVQLARQQPNNDTLRAQAAPTWYSGPWYNFPPMDTWLSFDAMFDRNKDSMKSTGSTWDDIGRINVAIRNAAQLGVDERVILGIIMQESHGYVGVRTTVSPDGIPTAGIMQCSGCPGYPGRTGLSQDEISGMVNGGTRHFKQNLQNHGDQWSAESIYPALREYNSGSVNPNDLSDGRGATASYVSDISQRLQGWVD